MTVMPNKQKSKHKVSISRKTQSLSTKWLSNPLIIIILSLIVLLTVSNIQISQNKAIAIPQNVLGESEESEAQKQAEEAAKEAAEQLEEEQKESAKEAEEQQKEAAKTATTNTTETSGSSRTSIKTETISPSGLKMKTESEGDKRETEIETAEGQKIKTKIEDDGTTKIEVETGLVNLKYKIEDGQLVLKVENEDGDEVEIEDDELEELENDVENELEDDDIRLVQTNDNQLALTQNQIAALTNFPLDINVETKELIVTTPVGKRVVTVLPDEAVQNLLVAGIINKVETPTDDAATQDQLGALTGVVKLEVRNNEMVYKVKGTKTLRMFGFIPVNTDTTVFVSTDNGVVMDQQRSVLANVVDFLSP